MNYFELFGVDPEQYMRPLKLKGYQVLNLSRQFEKLFEKSSPEICLEALEDKYFNLLNDETEANDAHQGYKILNDDILRLEYYLDQLAKKTNLDLSNVSLNLEFLTRCFEDNQILNTTPDRILKLLRSKINLDNFDEDILDESFIDPESAEAPEFIEAKEILLKCKSDYRQYLYEGYEAIRNLNLIGSAEALAKLRFVANILKGDVKDITI